MQKLIHNGNKHLIYLDRIMESQKKGNFIHTGNLINEARENGVKLNQLAVSLDVSVPALSHLSVVASRSTKEMQRWASQNKLGLKALREIVRMPEKYRNEVAERFVRGEVTTWVIDDLKHRINNAHKTNQQINIKEIIREIVTTRTASESKPVKRTRRQIRLIDIPVYEYNISDINDAMRKLMALLVGVPPELSEWEMMGLKAYSRPLKRMLNDLSNKIEK